MTSFDTEYLQLTLVSEKSTQIKLVIDLLQNHNLLLLKKDEYQKYFKDAEVKEKILFVFSMAAKLEKIKQSKQKENKEKENDKKTQNKLKQRITGRVKLASSIYEIEDSYIMGLTAITELIESNNCNFTHFLEVEWIRKLDASKNKLPSSFSHLFNKRDGYHNIKKLEGHKLKDTLDYPGNLYKKIYESLSDKQYVIPKTRNSEDSGSSSDDGSESQSESQSESESDSEQSRKNRKRHKSQRRKKSRTKKSDRERQRSRKKKDRNKSKEKQRNKSRHKKDRKSDRREQERKKKDRRQKKQRKSKQKKRSESKRNRDHSRDRKKSRDYSKYSKDEKKRDDHKSDKHHEKQKYADKNRHKQSSTFKQKQDNKKKYEEKHKKRSREKSMDHSKRSQPLLNTDLQKLKRQEEGMIAQKKVKTEKQHGNQQLAIDHQQSEKHNENKKSEEKQEIEQDEKSNKRQPIKQMDAVSNNQHTKVITNDNNIELPKKKKIPLSQRFVLKQSKQVKDNKNSQAPDEY